MEKKRFGVSWVLVTPRVSFDCKKPRNVSSSLPRFVGPFFVSRVAKQRGKDNEGAVADATVALDDKEEENKKDKKEILKWRSNIEIILIARA